jgi:hypothetical protein
VSAVSTAGIEPLFAALRRKLVLLWSLTCVALACGLVLLIPAAKLRQRASPEANLDTAIHFPPGFAARIEHAPESRIFIQPIGKDGSNFSQGAVVIPNMSDQIQFGTRTERSSTLEQWTIECRYSNDEAACQKTQRKKVVENWIVLNKDGMNSVEKDQMAYVQAQISASGQSSLKDSPVAARGALARIGGNWRLIDEPSRNRMRQLLDYLGKQGLDAGLQNAKRIATPQKSAELAKRKAALHQREFWINIAMTCFAVALFLGLIAGRRSLRARRLSSSNMERAKISRETALKRLPIPSSH